MLNMEDFLDMLKPIVVFFLIVTSFLGTALLFNLDEFPEKVKYYEDGIEKQAIEYHNEIYLKKGE